MAGDLNRDGVPEIVLGFRGPGAELLWLGREHDGRWRPHLIDDAYERLESGGALYDLDGDSDLDLIGGQDDRGGRIFWRECPDDPADRL